jgi:hypothetical protein
MKTHIPKIDDLLERAASKQRFRAKISGEARPAFAFLVTGGIGDLIVTARFVRDFLASVGGGKFDVYFDSPADADMIYRAIPGYRQSLGPNLIKYSKRLYAYFFELNQFIKLIFRISPLIAHFDAGCRHDLVKQKLNSILIRTDPISLLAEQHPFLDGQLGRYAVYKGRGRRDFLHYLADIPYRGDLFPLDADVAAAKRFGLSPDGFVTLHTGYDGAMSGARKTATKVFRDWSKVIEILRAKGFSLPIVQIGAPGTSDPIANVDVDLVGRTSLSDAKSLVAASAFHCDNEGGFVHIAAAFGKKCCVIFGPTDVDFFSYPDNLNIRPRKCGGCWWSERSWMTDCPRGDDYPVCMSSHDAEAIAAALLGKFANSG